MGCFSMFLTAFVGLILLVGGCWWFALKTIDRFTSPEPVAIKMEAPSDEQFASANQKLTTVREASRSHQATTVEFTAADLNALIARHPDYNDLRGKFHVAIADSLFTLQMSLSLADFPVRKLQDRWVNGSARFGLVYNNDDFNFSLRSLTANGEEIPLAFLDTLASLFSKGFNEDWDRSHRERRSSDEFWEDIKTMAVLDDKLVVTTKGPEVGSAPTSPTPEP
jgi:hypothetical protein